MKHFLVLFLVTLFVVTSFAADMTGLKKRIAVFEFDDRSGWGHNIGTGLADMLITQLVKTEKFMVIERKELDQIMAEQNLGLSGAVTPQSAAQVGQIIGVELIVMGSVSEFGEKKSGLGGSIGRLGIGGRVTKREARAVVDVRLVNTSTAEIVLAETAEGEDGSTGLDNFRFEDINFGNPTFWDRTIVGKAGRKAIDKCVGMIDRTMSNIPWEGKILRADPDGTIYMKPGSAGGVKSGMEFFVYAKGEDIIDPDTGISLGSDESKIGKIKVLSDIGDGKACKAQVITGTGFATGNLVRLK
jgi:curli biogenesis system outer membrane secretion channel CsgG